MVEGCVFAFAKQLNERDFLEHGDARNLQDCVEIDLDIEALLDDGDEHVDRDGNPDLGLDGVLGGWATSLTEVAQASPMREPMFKSITRRFSEIPFRYSPLKPNRQQTTGH